MAKNTKANKGAIIFDFTDVYNQFREEEQYALAIASELREYREKQSHMSTWQRIKNWFSRR